MITDEQKRAQIDALYAGARAKAFPGVPEISAREVIDRQIAGETFVLLDCRTPQEQHVSMIPGAITLEEFENDPAKYQGAAMVCYCTIGERSGQRTAELCARGINARNMPGAVLSWSHAGGTFVDESGDQTHRVHVHSPQFNLVAEGYEAAW